MKYSAEPLQAPVAWIALSDAGRAQGLSEALRRSSVEAHVQTRGVSLLRAHRPQRPSVLLLDAWLPDLRTDEILDRLTGGGMPPMFCLHLERPDTRTVVHAMRRGAFDCVEAQQGLEEVARVLLGALAEDRRRAQQSSANGAFCERLAALTGRQRQILDALLKGVTSKELALELNLSKKTIDFHRSQILRRLGVHSLVEAAVLVCSQKERDALAPRRREERALPKVP